MTELLFNIFIIQPLQNQVLANKTKLEKDIVREKLVIYKNYSTFAKNISI